MKRRDHQENQQLTVRQFQMEKVLLLFHEGTYSTHSIAAQVGICEREVCRMLEEVRAC